MVRIEDRILSPTAINTYLRCPRKFYLRYIKRLRTRPSIHLIRGHLVHKTLHEFHREHPGSPQGISLGAIRQELLSLFDNQWEAAAKSLHALGLKDQEIAFYHDESELMLFNFSHWFFKHDMPSPELSEAKIVSKNLQLMGIIDAVHRHQDKVILADYKTSRHPKVTNDILRQAALYALLYEDKYRVVPEAVWVHFLKDPGDP